MKKILQGELLVKRAKQLGIDIQGEPIYQSASGRKSIANEYELQRRVIEAERSIRESKLWLIALISAIASVASAIVALIAVLQ
ncbi:hypothetical protein KKB83_02030 [Patescibacteria group bacterium]|nr:hypothetical protein [Patescibacteria group bacterium]